MPEWPTRPLGEVVTNHDSRRIPLSGREREMRQGPYPYYGAAGIIDFVDEPIFRGLHLLIGEDGSVARDDGTPFALLADGAFWVNNHAHVLRAETDTDTRYLYYALRNTNIRPWVTGAVQPKLNQRNMNKIPLPYPARKTRDAIVRVLGALDDTIEQNQRTVRALERVARAIFRAWFVDFEPVKARAEGATAFPGVAQLVFDALPTRFVDSAIGPVPEGWEAKALADIATFLNGLPLQKYPARGDGKDLRVIKIAELRKGSTDGADLANSDVAPEYVIDDRDLLFSWSGTLEAEFWFGGIGALNQHLFKVSSSHFPSWFCLLWIRQHLPWFRAIAASKATTMGHIKRGHLKEAQVVVPPANVLQEGDRALGPLHDLHAQLMIESRKLATMRDYLLPRLLSGDVLLTAVQGEVARRA